MTSLPRRLSALPVTLLLVLLPLLLSFVLRTGPLSKLYARLEEAITQLPAEGLLLLNSQTNWTAPSVNLKLQIPPHARPQDRTEHLT